MTGASVQSLGWSGGVPRRRQVACCAVIAGHAALLLLAWQARRLPAGTAQARPSLMVQLLPPRPEHRRRPEAAPVSSLAALPRLPNLPLPALPSLSSEPAVTTVPAVGGDAVASDRSGAVGAAVPGAAASGPRSLDLRPSADVLRGALVNPATVDPRSNSPKPTFEERIAMGLDPTLCVKLERDPDGTVRRRMGKLGRAQSLLQSTHGVGAQGLLVCE